MATLYPCFLSFRPLGGDGQSKYKLEEDKGKTLKSSLTDEILNSLAPRDAAR